MMLSKRALEQYKYHFMKRLPVADESFPYEVLMEIEQPETARFSRAYGRMREDRQMLISLSPEKYEKHT